MDIYLNNITHLFSTIIAKSNILNETDIDNLTEIKKVFKETIDANLDAFFPPIMKTGTKLDNEEERLGAKKNDLGNIGFGNLNLNLLQTKAMELPKASEEFKFLEINNILNFEILPSLINLFVLS
jgi:hypothetical protein